MDKFFSVVVVVDVVSVLCDVSGNEVLRNIFWGTVVQPHKIGSSIITGNIKKGK